MDGQYLKWYYDSSEPVSVAPTANERSRSGTLNNEDEYSEKEKDGDCFKSIGKPQPEDRKLTITLERGSVPGVHAKRVAGYGGVEDPGVCEKMSKEGCVVM
jgi:hypothetical protein